MSDVRCPECSRLLAKRADDGSCAVIVHGKCDVVVESGSIRCVRCGIVVIVDRRPRRPGATPTGGGAAR